MSTPETSLDLWALSDLGTPWCIRVAVTLHIAEHIDAGITDIDALATATQSDAHVLHSVLSWLAGKGVFVESPIGRFALNETSRGLLDPGLFLDLNGIGGRMAAIWSTLPAFVRTGESGYAGMFGQPFWQDLTEHPELGADFDALMSYTGHGTPDASLELTAGWDGVRTVVDVGGGTGAMLAELLRVRPTLRGVLVDLPATVERAGATFEAAGVSDRVSLAPQSFFDPLPGGADLYLVRKVLNDWADRETVAILRRCAEAAGPSGVVVVIGGVVADGTVRPIGIDMLLVGGRTNTVSEFRVLAREAGLEVTAAVDGLSHFMVECRPIATD
jgi:2,7-dihydroxy-5-methyl-1-naphthoate 7-O-methyltransferase